MSYAKLEWCSYDFWKAHGMLLRVHASYDSYPPLKAYVCSLHKTMDGRIEVRFPPDVDEQTHAVSDEVVNLPWNPENLDKARALIEMVVRMEE